MRQFSYDFMMLYAVKVLISSHTSQNIVFNSISMRQLKLNLIVLLLNFSFKSLCKLALFLYI